MCRSHTKVERDRNTLAGTRTSAIVRYGATSSGMLPRTKRAAVNASGGMPIATSSDVIRLGRFKSRYHRASRTDIPIYFASPSLRATGQGLSLDIVVGQLCQPAYGPANYPMHSAYCLSLQQCLFPQSRFHLVGIPTCLRADVAGCTDQIGSVSWS